MAIVPVLVEYQDLEGMSRLRAKHELMIHSAINKLDLDARLKKEFDNKKKNPELSLDDIREEIYTKYAKEYNVWFTLTGKVQYQGGVLNFE